MLDPTRLPFIQANRYQSANRDHIDWIVIHTMESRRTTTAALDCARDFATTIDYRSAHYCIDCGTIVRCVQEKDIAYAAPPNTPGIQLEHAGYASLTEAEWHDEYSTKMLVLSARLAASVARRFEVPVAWLSAQDLLGGKRGFTSHANISDAYHRSDHQDPGPNFPRDGYLRLVQAEIDSAVALPPEAGAADDTGVAAASRILGLSQPPMVGKDIEAVQEALVTSGYPVAVDGEFGSATKRAVKAFQRAQGLSADGVVGPLTRRMLGLA